jgi:hypothetical protein
MKKKSGAIFALALVLVAFGSLAAVADEEATPVGTEVPSTMEAEGVIPVPIAGMTVFIDEETGELRQPSAEEAAALAKAMQKMFGASAGLAPAASAESVTATGGVALEVGPDQLNFSVATVAADGTVRFECLDSAHAAEAHVHGPIETAEDK